ncbi:hypothetical protein OIU78_017374 [Salix suchowensis]|nr:hypothetical protein OIU78_017374 [Salix suchowensis]
MAKAASSLTFSTSLPKLCRPFSISITQPPQVSLNSKKLSCSISSAFKISRRTVTTTKASSMASSGITTVDQNNRKVVEVFVTEEELAVSLAKYTADLSDKFAKERGSFHCCCVWWFSHQVPQEISGGTLCGFNRLVKMACILG